MSPRPFSWARGFLPAAVLVVVAQVLLAAGTGWPAVTGEFWGPDSYMRLARTLECEGGSACPGGLFADTNAPFGEVIHWPFLQDRLLLGLAAPFTTLLGSHDGLLVAASLFGPLLALGSVALVLLAARTLVGPPGLYLAGVLLAVQPWFFQAFASPRVDHHGLQGFLFLGMVVGVLHLRARAGAPRWAAATGVFLGLGLWVSTEALVSALPVLSGLGLLWVWQGGVDAARANRDASLAVVAVLSLGLLVDGPVGQPFAAEYDRFSVVHWSLFAAVTALWAGAVWLERANATTLPARLVWGSAGVSFAAGLTAILYPAFFGGPMVEMDPRLGPIWLDRISEFVPVAGNDRPLSVSLHLASSLLAVPAAIYCALRDAPARRTGWWFLVGTLSWFIGLALFLHGRWALYLHLLVPVPLAWLLGRLVQLAARARPALLPPVAEVGAVGAIAAFPLFFALPLAHAEGDEEAEGRNVPAPGQCVASDIVPFLSRLEQQHGPGTLLVPVDWAPEIVFRTGHRTVGSPYHRNSRGLLDTHEFMATRNHAAALSIATARGIDWVVMCRHRPWFPVVDSGPPGTLYSGLLAGTPPEWLRSIALPQSLAESFSVFRVVGASAERS